MVPHYAVKSNNDTRLLHWLRREGVNFDCASPKEISQVLGIGARPAQIIYANPCKSHADILNASRSGVSTTVVDSPEEVQKLAESCWKGTALIRLKVPDAGSAQPFSRKFGAPLEWVSDILYALRTAGIHHSGWSFHVGSMCGQPKQFSGAIALCAEAEAIARTRSDVVDIGGGFIADPAMFADAAAEIRTAQTLFDTSTRWIGEPGRFLSSPVVTLHVQVIGVKRGASNSKIYTVDESVYGSFSNIPFDGQTPSFRLLSPDADDRPQIRATLFGRTCDSADCIADSILLPELRVGDTLEVERMGAYTTVSASFFNGFPMADRVYQCSDVEH